MAEEADYLTQLTGGNSGFNAMLASNSDDESPKKSNSKPMGTGEYQKNVSEDRKKLDALQVKEDKLPFATPPEMKEAPKPENYQTDPMQKFGSAGSVIATLGSLFTRKKMTNSFKSLAEVNNSISQGDASKFKTAYDTWKVDNDNAIKMAEWQQKNIKDHLDRIKDGESNVDADLRLLAISTGDPSLEEAVRVGQADNIFLTRKQKLQDLKSSSETIKDRMEFAQAKIDDAAAKKGQPLTPQETIEAKVAADKEFDAKPSAKTTSAPSTVDWNSLKPEDIVPGTGDTLAAIDQKVDTLHNGGSYSDAGIPMRSANNPLKDAVDNRLAVKYPDFNRVQAEVDLAGDKAESRREGIISGSLKTASNLLDQSIPLLRDASKNIDQSNWTDLNSFENYFKTHQNDPNLVKFRVALQTTMNDYTALGVRNGQTSDHARTSTEKLVNDLMSKRGIDAFADQIEKEKDSVLRGVDVTRGKSNANNVAPEGTIIHNGNVTKKKVNGEWVTQ